MFYDWIGYWHWLRFWLKVAGLGSGWRWVRSEGYGRGASHTQENEKWSVRVYVFGIDIKGANILVTTNGRCKLSDFGASRYLNHGQSRSLLHRIRLFGVRCLLWNSLVNESGKYESQVVFWRWRNKSCVTRTVLLNENFIGKKSSKSGQPTRAFLLAHHHLHHTLSRVKIRLSQKVWNVQISKQLRLTSSRFRIQSLSDYSTSWLIWPSRFSTCVSSRKGDQLCTFWCNLQLVVPKMSTCQC